VVDVKVTDGPERKRRKRREKIGWGGEEEN